MVPQITGQKEKYRDGAKRRGGMDDNIGNKRKERREKGAKQEHGSEAKGTVESLNMEKIKKEELSGICAEDIVYFIVGLTARWVQKLTK
jgi:hypothetical protein